MLKFTPVIHGLHEIPEGVYIAYLESGEQVLLEVQQIAKGTLGIINSCQFAFECSPVVAYAPFPELKF